MRFKCDVNLKVTCLTYGNSVFWSGDDMRSILFYAATVLGVFAGIELLLAGPLPDSDQKEAAEKCQLAALQYIQRIPRGLVRATASNEYAEVDWHLMFDGDNSHVRSRRRLKQKGDDLHLAGLFQEAIYTPTARISFNDAPHAAIQVSPWENSHLSASASGIFSPRYLGTAIVPSLSNMAESAERGVFGQIFVAESLKLIDGRDDFIDGVPVIVGLYDRQADRRSVELWWSTDEPVRLLRARASVSTPTTDIVDVVDVVHKRWPCGVVFPEKITMTSLVGGRAQSEEVVTIHEFEIPSHSPVDFTPLACEAPDETTVMTWDTNHQIISYQKVRDGQLVSFTPQDFRDFEDLTRVVNGSPPLAADGHPKQARLSGTAAITLTALLAIVLTCVWIFRNRRRIT
jgi:hypothetical protein